MNREQLMAAADDKPIPFRSVALKGATTYIEQMTGLNINSWWRFYYGIEPEAKEAPQYIYRAAEMVKRCCVDADGKRIFEKDNVADLVRDRKLGRFLAEFYEECTRVNGLFVGREAEVAHRRSFFAEKDGVKTPSSEPSETPATTSSASSDSAEAKETSTA